ncbi:MAG TPA: transcription elongation factor GreA [Candidatus Dojkabacteria bacterium]|nr:transcription elongation factor GreA [Candidatus Dojkabacteria bacterium]
MAKSLLKTEKFSISGEGLLKLKQELKHLLKVSRKKIADEIDRARQQGDLSENAAYKSALESKEFNETRIKELEDMINNSQIINITQKDRIGLGNKVKLHNINRDRKVTYHIVGEQEADTGKGNISLNSPLGVKLMGKSKGDTVNIDSPSGKLTFKILDII